MSAAEDVAELGDIDVDHRTGMVAFVAADRLTSDSIDAAEPVHPAADQNGEDGRWCDAELASDLDRTETAIA